jgi:DNA-binding NarL/FixJ family response regulator
VACVAAAGSDEPPPPALRGLHALDGGSGDGRAPGASRRVVLADDSAGLRTLIRTLLELEPGFEVAGEAADGIEAIETVLRVEPDLLLLDLAMPRADGLQVLQELRGRLPGLRIVVYSGYTSAELEQAALDLGADAYVPKGGQPDELIRALAAIG